MESIRPVIAALEAAYQVAMQNHPDARPAVIVVYRGKRGNTRGYFHSEQFVSTRGKVDELQIDSTILSEPPRQVMRTLLHELCHSIAEGTGVKDTSRNGKYHNGKFKAIAQSVGLMTGKDPRAGIVTPNLTDDAAQKYAPVIEMLGDALTLYQEMPQVGKVKQTTRLVKATCACGRIIRASKKVLEQGGIVCELCGDGFVV